MYVVKKPFPTPTRRFSVGDKVNGDDLRGPVPIDHWLAGKFIEAEKVEKPPKAAPPPSPPEATT